MPCIFKLTNKNQGRSLCCCCLQGGCSETGRASVCTWQVVVNQLPLLVLFLLLPTPPPLFLHILKQSISNHSLSNNICHFCSFCFLPHPIGVEWGKSASCYVGAWLLYRANPLQQVIQKTHAMFVYYTLLRLWCKTCPQYSVSAIFYYFCRYLYGTVHPITWAIWSY